MNIGAFPLLPADEGHKDDIVLSNLLEKHLQAILLDNSAFEQIKNSIPQKGLQYRECGKENGVALIMIENYDDKHNKFSNGKIAVPIKLTESDMTLLEKQAEITYVLFHTRKKKKRISTSSVWRALYAFCLKKMLRMKDTILCSQQQKDIFA